MTDRPTELDRVREYEEENYRMSTEQLLGPAANLSPEAVELYEVMTSIAVSGPAKIGGDDILALSFLTACKYELTMASLDVLRCHLLASYPHTRRALELCAFAARIKNDLARVNLWLDASKDEQAYWKYWNEFRPTEVFPKNHPILSRLYQRYTDCSRLSHPSVYSLALQTSIKQNLKTTDVRVEYFQAEEDGSDVARTFLWTIDTHFLILLVFQDEVMQDLLANDPKRWAIRRDAFEAQLATQKSRFRSLVHPAKKPAPGTTPTLIWTP